MTRFRLRRRPAAWPIVLLMIAWFCANSPQSVTFHLIVWAKGAQHFSHQESLKAEVAFLLAGKQAGAIRATFRPTPPAAPRIPVPEEAVLKKIDLAGTEPARTWLAATVKALLVTAPQRAWGILRAAPPRQPPRTDRIA